MSNYFPIAPSPARVSALPTSATHSCVHALAIHRGARASLLNSLLPLLFPSLILPLLLSSRAAEESLLAEDVASLSLGTEGSNDKEAATATAADADDAASGNDTSAEEVNGEAADDSGSDKVAEKEASEKAAAEKAAAAAAAAAKEAAFAAAVAAAGASEEEEFVIPENEDQREHLNLVFIGHVGE